VGMVGRLPWVSAVAVGSFALLVQFLALGVHGLTGRTVSYTRHGPIARFALAHFPSLYNPEPEVFLERSLGREAPPSAHRAVAWPTKGRPVKILVTHSGPVRSPSLCRGGDFHAASIVEVNAGMRYLNAPFRCRKKR
jgi:hypothetical protein